MIWKKKNQLGKIQIKERINSKIFQIGNFQLLEILDRGTFKSEEIQLVKLSNWINSIQKISNWDFQIGKIQLESDEFQLVLEDFNSVAWKINS